MKPIIFISLIIFATSFTGPLDYADQTTWPDDCTTGKYQSPINIPDASNIGDDTEYKNKRLIIEEINYTPISTVTVGYEHKYSLSTPTLDNGGIKVRINGTLYSYKVKNIHFHLNSEHTINNKYYQMEMHIVHENENKDEKNQHLVLGYLFENGSENSFLNEIGLGSGQEAKNVKISNIVKNETVYYYKGGLTTPPCSETVNWVVIKDIKKMSEAQFNKFKLFVGTVNENYLETGNNRTIYKLNGRKVYISDPNDASSDDKSTDDDDDNSSFLKNKLSWILLLIMIFN